MTIARRPRLLMANRAERTKFRPQQADSSSRNCRNGHAHCREGLLRTPLGMVFLQCKGLFELANPNFRFRLRQHAATANSSPSLV